MKKYFFGLFFSTLLLSACTEETSTSIIEPVDIKELVASANVTAEKHDISEFEQYELQEIIDGDTIRIKYNGISEKVRFLLVDAPEVNHETWGEQAYGPEAKEYVKQLLAGQESVYLEFDVSYRDKYKRLLAYIYTKDGISVQEQLLKNGLVRVAYIYDPNTRHEEWFKSIEKTAQQAVTGVWSVKDYVTNRGYDQDVYYDAMKVGHPSKVDEDNLNNTSSKSSCEIKGNINSKGNKIYHMPGQLNYENTVAEEIFCTEEEAEEAGFIPAEQ